MHSLYNDNLVVTTLYVCIMGDKLYFVSLYFLQLRMQHEVYPEDTTQSTRFVLLVREVELVDRLAASQLNKFLSQYVSNTMPKQTHANMVRCTCILTRLIIQLYMYIYS